MQIPPRFRTRYGPVLVLPVLVFTAGVLSQRAGATLPPQESVGALHQALGIDLKPKGQLANLGNASETADVGPVSSAFFGRVDSLRVVAHASPENSDVALQLAGVLQDAHLDDEAITYLERIVEAAPHNRQAWLDLADSYGRLQQWGGVQSAMTRMLDVHPDDPSAAYNLGAAHANAGDFNAAKRRWAEVVERDIDPEVTALARVALRRIPT